MIGYIYKFENSSITEAAKYYNLPKSCISRVCKNERKSCGGFIWKYY